MHRFSLVWMILAAVTAVLPFQNIAPVIQVTNLEVIGYTFGEEITFRAVAISESPIQQARLVLQLPGKTEEQTIAADIKSLNAGGMQLQATYKLAGQNLPAFSTLGYYFKVVTPTGQEYTSPLARFDYLDNRYEWQTLPGTRFQVHWFNGNSDTAQSVQQIAQAGYERMQDLLELKELPQVEIYIYPDSASLQGVLAESGKDWIAGRAALEKGVILVALPLGPDQQVFV